MHNHLEVVLPTGDYRDDATLTTMANNALTLNIPVPNSVEATAKNGNLTLTGTVSYGAERTAARHTVAGLTGVRNLSDDIVISNDANPVDVTLSVQEARVWRRGGVRASGTICTDGTARGRSPAWTSWSAYTAARGSRSG